MSSFPKHLTIILAETANFSSVFETETGTPIPCVRGFRVDVDAGADGGGRPSVEILLDGVSMTIVTEEPRYILDEETLRRLVADNGFDLVPKFTHPGEILLEDFLKPTDDIVQDFLAKVPEEARPRMLDVVQKAGPVTSDLASLIATLTGSAEDFWLNLQKTYDDQVARTSGEPAA